MQPVYVNGVDHSVPSMLSVMPNVIEKSVRTVVMHGGVDYVLIAEGTRCVALSDKGFHLCVFTRDGLFRIAIQSVPISCPS